MQKPWIPGLSTLFLSLWIERRKNSDFIQVVWGGGHCLPIRAGLSGRSRPLVGIANEHAFFSCRKACGHVQFVLSKMAGNIPNVNLIIEMDGAL